MTSTESSYTAQDSTPPFAPMIRLTRAPTTSTAVRALLDNCKQVLKSFIDSRDPFRVAYSIPEHPALHDAGAPNSKEAGGGVDAAQNQRDRRPQNNTNDKTKTTKTLFIFDSSFNPPTLAHMALALAAFPFNSQTKTQQQQHPDPHRLLLLFSTHNADKAGTSPAAFEHRLAMMVLFALDLRQIMRGRLRAESSGTDEPIDQSGAENKEQYEEHDNTNDVDVDDDIPIDVGLTTKPYYTDKTTAIISTSTTTSSSNPSLSSTAPSLSPSPSHPYLPPPHHPTHIHLVGYDTYTRILTPKYYQDTFNPPLAALNPYFDAGHGFVVMVREENATEETGTGEKGGTSGDERGKWGTPDEQAWKVGELARGELESMGGKREWGAMVQWVGDEGVGKGVSSTRVRNAMAMGTRKDIGVVRSLCTEGVAGWIERWGLYEEQEQ